ncbi:MAG: hypothetical protein ACLU8J_11805 [Acutalibacter sp.]
MNADQILVLDRAGWPRWAPAAAHPPKGIYKRIYDMQSVADWTIRTPLWGGGAG